MTNTQCLFVVIAILLVAFMLYRISNLIESIAYSLISILPNEDEDDEVDETEAYDDEDELEELDGELTTEEYEEFGRKIEEKYPRKREIEEDGSYSDETDEEFERRKSGYPDSNDRG